MTTSILKELNQPPDTSDVILKIIELIKEYSGFEAVGLRLKENDDYPFYKTIGFSADFISAENLIAVKKKSAKSEILEKNDQGLECICGAVISGAANSNLPNYTKHGTFWTNNFVQASKLFDSCDINYKMRNRCLDEGYNSIALIPIFYSNTTIGLLQMDDKRKNIWMPLTSGCWKKFVFL
jgi:hypothetical protein